MHLCVTQQGMTALMKAVYNCHIETVRVLLAAGADIDLQDKVSADSDDI